MKTIIYKKYHSVTDYFMDIKYGVKTSKYKILEENRTIHGNYEPTLYLELNRLFSKYPFSSNDHIIDYGCGKGRVLFVAAYNRCRNITGIEINKEMYIAALENLDRFKSKNRTNSIINIYNMDAKDYNSLDEINKFFFFNPFHLKVFLKVFNLIHSSIEKHPREVTLFFYMPVMSWIQEIEKSNIFRLVDEIFINNIEPYDDCVGFGFLVYSNISECIEKNSYRSICCNKTHPSGNM